MTNIDVLKHIDGAATARRVGTDAMSPSFAQLLPIAFPHAELVDGEAAMRAARRVKTDEEIAALRHALAVAETGMAAAVSRLSVGVTEQALTGAMLEAMAAGGVSTSATQDGAWITSREHAWRVGRRDRRVAPGDLVALSSGALADGYVGEVGRTLAVGTCPGPTGSTGAPASCRTDCSTPAAPAHRRATCSPRTRLRERHFRRCRWPTASVSASIRR